MNAYQLYDAAFDTANDYAENTIAYVKQYAEGALDTHVSDAVAQKIVDARIDYLKATESNGEGQNNLWHIVQKPLEQIEL